MRFEPEFFVYPIGSETSIAGSKLVEFDELLDVVAISGDSDFECKRLVCFAVDSLADLPVESTRRLPNFNFNLRDNATGRLMFNTYVSTAALFGDGRIPFVLPTTHFFRRNSIVQMLFDPSDPGPDFGSILCWLGLVGVKHFDEVLQ